MQTNRLETLGSAAAGIAHDINNELTVILNHLAETNIDAARHAVSRCASLTSGLLSYCRGESLTLTALDPEEFLREFTAGLQLPTGIRLHLRISSPVRIMADQAALRRALINLVLNASDALRGDGIVRIGVCGHTIFVEDNGPGVTPEVAKRMFNPFFTTKGPAGTGLGLAIVREIMAQHAGRVTLHSQAGHGARFELRFRPAAVKPERIH